MVCLRVCVPPAVHLFLAHMTDRQQIGTHIGVCLFWYICVFMHPQLSNRCSYYRVEGSCSTLFSKSRLQQLTFNMSEFKQYHRRRISDILILLRSLCHITMSNSVSTLNWPYSGDVYKWVRVECAVKVCWRILFTCYYSIRVQIQICTKKWDFSIPPGNGNFHRI